MRTIAEILEGKQLTFVEPRLSVRDAARLMSEQKVGAVPVLESGKLVGLFSERDLMTRVVAAGLDPDTTRIDAVMTSDLVVASPDDQIDECVQKMHSLGCRHLPIVEQDELIGIISLRDLLQVDNQQARAKVDFLKDLVTYRPDYES